MGSTGSSGRGFLDDIRQADLNSILLASVGGAIFNLSNLLVIAAIAIAGFSVAYPVTGGLALVLGNFGLHKSSHRQPGIAFSWGRSYCNRYHCERCCVSQDVGKKGRYFKERNYYCHSFRSYNVFLLSICLRWYEYGFYNSGAREVNAVLSNPCFFSRFIHFEFYLEQFFYVPAIDWQAGYL